MANIKVTSMEELPTPLKTFVTFANRLEKMTWKIQWQKRVSFRYCINKYSISAFVFVLNHWLSGAFKADLSDFFLKIGIHSLQLYEALSYKKRSTKKITGYKKSV